MFVIAIFVRHIPIGQNKDTRWEPFPLSSLFRVADFEIDVIAIFQLLIKGPLKSVGPLGVVLNDFFKVVEELAISVYTRDLNVGAGMLNEITLEERDGFQSFQANHEAVKGMVEFNDLLKKS